MSFESPQEEVKGIELTTKEFNILANSDKNDPEFSRIMTEKNITFGDAVPILVNGEHRVMGTTEADFGTILEGKGYASSATAEMYEKWTGKPYERIEE